MTRKTSTMILDFRLASSKGRPTVRRHLISHCSHSKPTEPSKIQLITKIDCGYPSEDRVREQKLQESGTDMGVST